MTVNELIRVLCDMPGDAAIAVTDGADVVLPDGPDFATVQDGPTGVPTVYLDMTAGGTLYTYGEDGVASLVE